jgi:hypothetical protein
MAKKQARMGRPPLPKGRAKRQTAGLRMTTDLRRALEAAARRTGRSLSQEMEALLEMAIGRRQALPTLLDHAYGFHTSVLLLLIGDLSQTGETLELDWLNTPAGFARMRRAIALLLDLLDPALEGLSKPRGDDGVLLLLTRLFATPPHPLYKDWALERRLRLGDSALTRLTERLSEAEAL